jgi:hypothetical protein
MQTFLPYADFIRSAQVLDRQRLGKQRLEARSILKINLGIAEGSGWRRHPAVLMWKGYESALARYGAAICCEWLKRGYTDHQLGFFLQVWRSSPANTSPPWLGDEVFHASHRAALLFKNPSWYGQFGWSEESGVHYLWPRKVA